MSDTAKRIAELEKELAESINGYISRKVIKGKERFYLQWTENGKLKSRYIKTGELEQTRALVERRKSLQAELKKLKATPDGVKSYNLKRKAVRNMQNPLVQEYLNERREARSKRTQITQDFVLGELMKIATANGTDFASVGKGNRVRLTPTEELPPEKRAAVASVKKGRDGMEIKTYDKLRALELLGKHLGMFDAKSGREEADALEKLDRLLEGIGDAAAE